jgi:biopolymer transport protein ExbB
MIWLQVQQVTEQVVTKQLTLFELVMKGGVILIPITILLFASIYIFIERYQFIKRVAQPEPDLLNTIKTYLRDGNLKTALDLCRARKSATARIYEAALNRMGNSLAEIESSIESVANIIVTKMTLNLNYLGIIAGVAPMLGFVGTITGIIRIFYEISLSDNISIGIIAGGLYEKMITSLAGLVVGIIAYTGYHLLSIKVDKFALKMESDAYELLSFLSEPQ